MKETHLPQCFDAFLVMTDKMVPTLVAIVTIALIWQLRPFLEPSVPRRGQTTPAEILEDLPLEGTMLHPPMDRSLTINRLASATHTCHPLDRIPKIRGLLIGIRADV